MAFSLSLSVFKLPHNEKISRITTIGCIALVRLFINVLLVFPFDYVQSVPPDSLACGMPIPLLSFYIPTFAFHYISGDSTNSIRKMVIRLHVNGITLLPPCTVSIGTPLITVLQYRDRFGMYIGKEQGLECINPCRAM